MSVRDAPSSVPMPPLVPISGLGSASGQDVSSNDDGPWMNLLGVRLSAVDLPAAVSRLLSAVAAGRRGYVCVRDAHGLVRCRTDPVLRRVHNEAMMVTPDGMPLVWSLRAAGHGRAGRVYGPDLMLAMMDQGRRAGLRHYLYGTTPGTLARLEAGLLRRFSDVRIVGAYSPPFRSLTPDERIEVAARINAAGPDIVWVGLSTPKQELWMAEMRDALAAPVLIGVGAAFDFHAGITRQAPRAIQRSGLEWLFRLACEPRRLWRRYAVTVPAFIGLVLAQALGLGRFPIGSDPATAAPGPAVPLRPADARPTGGPG